MTRWSDEQRAILEARTQALARPPRRPEARTLIEVVEVKVAGEAIAIPTSAILSVTALRRVVALPHAPPSIAGLLAAGGVVLPVFYLRALLDLPLVALPERAFALLVGDGGPELALAVDEVAQVRPIDVARLRPPPASLGAARDLVSGMDPGGVPLLDAAALLASETLIVDIPLPAAALSETSS